MLLRSRLASCLALRSEVSGGGTEPPQQPRRANVDAISALVKRRRVACSPCTVLHQLSTAACHKPKAYFAAGACDRCPQKETIARFRPNAEAAPSAPQKPLAFWTACPLDCVPSSDSNHSSRVWCIHPHHERFCSSASSPNLASRVHPVLESRHRAGGLLRRRAFKSRVRDAHLRPGM